MNRNVWVMLVYTGLVGIASGIWGFAVLAPYLYDLENGSNTKVGYTEAVQGICQALAALPAGYLSDRFPRHWVIKFGATLGLLCTFLFLYALHLGEINDHHKKAYLWMNFAMGVTGVFYGMINPPCMALYADSVPTGERSKWLTRRFSLVLLAISVGPLTNIVMFHYMGDKWSLPTLTTVFRIGIWITVPSKLVLFLFHDDYCLGEAAASHQEYKKLANAKDAKDAKDAKGKQKKDNAKDLGVVLLDEDSEGSDDMHNGDDGDVAGDESSAMSSTNHFDEDLDDKYSILPISSTSLQNGSPPRSVNTTNDDVLRFSAGNNRYNKNTSDIVSCCCCFRKPDWLTVSKIPGILAISDMMFGLASGMTIKFFPLFFKNAVHLSPIGVNTLYCISPLIMAIVTWMLQKLSRCFGRVQVQLTAKSIGIPLMVVLAMLKSEWTNSYLIVIVYIVRTACMNCGSPLMKSILMDNVDKKHRAKWQSLDSVTAFGWSGSAALGGWLTDHYGFEMTFTVTAAMQFVAWLPLLLLLPLVPAKEQTNVERVKQNSR